MKEESSALHRQPDTSEVGCYPPGGPAWLYSTALAHHLRPGRHHAGAAKQETAPAFSSGQITADAPTSCPAGISLGDLRSTAATLLLAVVVTLTAMWSKELAWSKSPPLSST